MHVAFVHHVEVQGGNRVHDFRFDLFRYRHNAFTPWVRFIIYVGQKVENRKCDRDSRALIINIVPAKAGRQTKLNYAISMVPDEIHSIGQKNEIIRPVRLVERTLNGYSSFQV